MATSRNIILFPYLAQGHLIPFLDLARLLEQHTHQSPSISITLLSTPLNIQNLRHLLPSTSKIHLQSLPFNPTVHGLPPHVENTDSCPSPSHIINVSFASRSLQPQFEEFITQQLRSDPNLKLYLITDVFVSWTVPIAKKLSIPHVVFTTCGALGTAAYMSMWLHLPHRQTDEEYFPVPGFPDSFRLHRSQMSYGNRVSDGTDESYKFLCCQIRLSLQSDLMICNTVEELEPLGLQALRDVTGISTIHTIGPLVPLQEEKSYQRAGKEFGIKREACLQWLDTRAEHSVIYICFGSQNTITAAHMLALAEGLESSGVPFVWVIRPPIGTENYESTENNKVDDEKQQMPKWLPQGFIERMTCTRQGLLVWRWAPQLEILTHKATGAFLSHCGWNSVLESLSRGVPLIGWPLAAEQFSNAKMLDEELGVLVEINRGVECELESREVERAVKEVISGEKGKEMRSKASVCKEIIKNAMAKKDSGEEGSSLRSLHELVDFFMKH
ncbi:crocetin glucosyltransferase 3-like protein [Carex littledalei]|uniref:Glycosyltransferase n=1 Tax=Carex littledalei TaxID=544730 RepID=A0A833VDI4_9POAL|nr:crocetin glucosyltransferase 3-like protein [Carex littledalei]